MFKRTLTKAITGSLVAAAALGALSACPPEPTIPAAPHPPTVKLMVGGIDKQIYLPYKLAEKLGFYKKYGVNVVLSTESDGGVGAEDAIAAGQVDMAGAWYVHTIDFQAQGKAVEDIVQLSGAPGEREMCATGSNVHTVRTCGQDPRRHRPRLRYRHLTMLSPPTPRRRPRLHRIAVGAGRPRSPRCSTTPPCVMTTQPTVNAIGKQNIGYSAIDLATTAGVQQARRLQPTAGVLARADWVNSHKDIVQKVVTALVATMHWIATHSATDIANACPPRSSPTG